MAINRFYNIIGSTGVTVELLAPFSQVNNIKSIIIANTHDSDAATVTLFIEDQPTSGTSNTFNIINTLHIPFGTSLVLEDTDIPNIPSKFGTYITVGSTDQVDVLMDV